MKKITFTFLLVSCFCSVYSYSQLTNGLKAYYPFGGNAQDMSGNNHNIGTSGSPVLSSDRMGTANCAYAFPGLVDTYMYITNAADFNIPASGAMTISLWYMGGSPDVSDLEILFEKPGTGSDNYDLVLYDLNTLSFGYTWSSVNPPIPDVAWHHAVAVYDNKKWYLYSDNVLVGSDETQTLSLTQTTSDIVIGKGFLGKMDDIRFYDRALSVSEVDQLFNFGGSCSAAGVSEIEAGSGITIFPNPTSASFTIDSQESNIESIVICDMNGREILNQQATGLSTQLNLSTYPNGLYFVKISGDNFIENRMIQKLD